MIRNNFIIQSGLYIDVMVHTHDVIVFKESF